MVEDPERLSVQLPRLAVEDLDRITERVQRSADVQGRMRALLEAVLVVSRELELPVVLRRIVTTAMELADARYGALGMLDADGEGLSDFVTVGLDEREMAALEGVPLPQGRGLLGHLIHHPGLLRVDDIGSHPESVGFPAGHPPMRTLLGVALEVRGRVYGDLYLADRRDGKPFDDDDEAVVAALAGAAGVAIENARLYERVRSSAEHFQRLLLPRLPDLAPFQAGAVYQPATASGAHLGGDWYDALLLPDGACAAVIGDVVGHDLTAAAAMAQTRNMLRALLYDRRTAPSETLTRLDDILRAFSDTPVTTACLARFEPSGDGYKLTWSSAGHPPLLVMAPDGARYLNADPGVPLGVEPALARPQHTRPLPPGATVVLYTDGLIEHRHRSLDQGMRRLATIASAHAEQPVDRLCRALADQAPSDGYDDLAVLALRVPSAT